MISFFNGQFLEKSKIAISPDDRGFLFADGLYEVIRSYGGELFRLKDHLQRLENGLRALSVGGVNLSEIESAAHRLLTENDLAEATVYIQITRGVAPRNHRFPPVSITPTVYLDANPCQSNVTLQDSGATAILVSDQRWARCDIKTIGLLGNVLAQQRAAESGAFEALLVRDGAVLEASRNNVCFVREGQLLMAPLNNYVLPGVTRGVVLGLAASLGIKVLLQPCFEHEIAELEEVFVCGTTAEVMPIISIGGRPVGEGKPGPVTQSLQKAFRVLPKV